MMDGFNLDSPLVCEGIVGDGCGGGRIFYVEESRLYAYDPVSKDSLLLLENLKDPEKIKKKGCIITIECMERTEVLDLSLL